MHSPSSPQILSLSVVFALDPHLCCADAAEWIYTIKQLLGRKAVSLITGKQHTQVRRLLAPAFTPKVSQLYIPRTTEIAQEMCAEWAKEKFVKGEDTMKAFTFQVSLSPDLTKHDRI